MLVILIYITVIIYWCSLSIVIGFIYSYNVIISGILEGKKDVNVFLEIQYVFVLTGIPFPAEDTHHRRYCISYLQSTLPNVSKTVSAHYVGGILHVSTNIIYFGISSNQAYYLLRYFMDKVNAL